MEIFNEVEVIRDDKDWIEQPEFLNIIYESQNETVALDTTPNPGFDKAVIENWYLQRIVDIESTSGLVDIALSFAELAIVNGCSNISHILENLRTLYTLIYECKNETQTFYSLQYIEQLNELEKLTLIMSHSYEFKSELYTKNLQEWLLPFVMRRPTLKQRECLLREFLLKTAKEDLHPCLKLFHLRLKETGKQLFADINLIPMLIDCLYENDEPSQLELCQQLSAEMVMETCLASAQLNQPNNKKLIISQEQHEQLKLVQIRLKACDMFKKYGVNKTLPYIRDSCLNKQNCHDSVVKLTWLVVVIF